MRNKTLHIKIRNTKKQSGVALIMALGAISVLIMIGMSIMTTMGARVNHTRSNLLGLQSHWALVSAEQYVNSLLTNFSNNVAKNSLDDFWQKDTIRFGIESGRLKIHIRDEGDCLNINGLARKYNTPETLIMNENIFITLMKSLDISTSKATQTIQRIENWIDTDKISNGFDGEDTFALRLNPARYSANTLLNDISELYDMQIDAEIFAKIRPYVCVWNNMGALRLNLNTVRSPYILNAFMRDNISLADAKAFLKNRPQKGYNTLQEVIDALEIGEDDFIRISGILNSSLYKSTISIQIYGVKRHYTVQHRKINGQFTSTYRKEGNFIENVTKYIYTTP